MRCAPLIYNAFKNGPNKPYQPTDDNGNPPKIEPVDVFHGDCHVTDTQKWRGIFENLICQRVCVCG